MEVIWLIAIVWVACGYYALGHIYSGFTREYDRPTALVQSMLLSLLGPFAFLFVYLQGWFGKRLYPWQSTRWKK